MLKVLKFSLIIKCSVATGLLFAGNVYADTIFFNDGSRMDGVIINQNNTSVTIRSGNRNHSFRKQSVLRITYGEAAPVVKPKVVEVKPKPEMKPKITPKVETKAVQEGRPMKQAQVKDNERKKKESPEKITQTKPVSSEFIKDVRSESWDTLEDSLNAVRKRVNDRKEKKEREKREAEAEELKQKNRVSQTTTPPVMPSPPLSDLQSVKKKSSPISNSDSENPYMEFRIGYGAGKGGSSAVDYTSNIFEKENFFSLYQKYNNEIEPKSLTFVGNRKNNNIQKIANASVRYTHPMILYESEVVQNVFHASLKAVTFVDKTSSPSGEDMRLASFHYTPIVETNHVHRLGFPVIKSSGYTVNVFAGGRGYQHIAKQKEESVNLSGQSFSGSQRVVNQAEYSVKEGGGDVALEFLLHPVGSMMKLALKGWYYSLRGKFAYSESWTEMEDSTKYLMFGMQTEGDAFTYGDGGSLNFRFELIENLDMFVEPYTSWNRVSILNSELTRFASYHSINGFQTIKNIEQIMMMNQMLRMKTPMMRSLNNHSQGVTFGWIYRFHVYN